jgi:predicted enzyme related to lactoylglutathione lyase
VKKIFYILNIIILFFSFNEITVQAADNDIPTTNSSVTFLYYKDLAEAENFYGGILGFQKDFDGGWVKIFRIADGGRVGLVDETKGYLKTASDKPVMLSIDTSDIRLWYERVKETGARYIKTHLKPESEGFANSFLLTDPEGYHVEFFQWNKEHKKY